MRRIACCLAAAACGTRCGGLPVTRICALLSVTVSFITGISAVTGLLLLLLTVLLCITRLLLLLTVLLCIAGLLLLLTVLLCITRLLLLLSISLPRRTLLAVLLAIPVSRLLLAVLLAIGTVILCHAGEASIVILAERTSGSHED